MQVVAAMDALNFSRNPSEQYGLQSCEREAVDIQTGRPFRRTTFGSNSFSSIEADGRLDLKEARLCLDKPRTHEKKKLNDALW